MKLPLGWVWSAVDLGFEVAIRIDRWLTERKARRRRGLSFKDVQHQQDQIARATRARAHTVVLRRRAPPATSPPEAGGGAPPTAPTRPGRGR